jgi:hypothetical protein
MQSSFLDPCHAMPCYATGMPYLPTFANEVDTYTHTHTHIHIHPHIHTHIHLHIHLHIHIHIYIYIYFCVHIHTQYTIHIHIHFYYLPLTTPEASIAASHSKTTKPKERKSIPYQPPFALVFMSHSSGSNKKQYLIVVASSRSAVRPYLVQAGNTARA